MKSDLPLVLHNFVFLPNFLTQLWGVCMDNVYLFSVPLCGSDDH